MTTPTTTPDARTIIAWAMHTRYCPQEATCADGPDECDYADADAYLAALTEAGYVIAQQPTPGAARVTISREDLRARIETAWGWLHCGYCGRENADDSPENVRLVVDAFLNAIEAAGAESAPGEPREEETA